VAEIPEHLLKRSQERRAALAGDSGTAAEGAAPAAPSTSPATTSAAAPAAPASTAPAGRGAAAAPAVPPPPKPDSAVVAAYKRRKRIPFWAMLALSLLPVWAFMYARAVTTQAEEVAGPLAVGEDVYGTCASCHGATGGGGIGYAFADGEVLRSFPHIEDQLRWVYWGTEGYNAAGVEIYTDPNREGGPHVTGGSGAVMPAQRDVLSGDEILGVVCHERYTIGGAELGGDFAEEYEKWCAEESEIFADLEGGGDLLTLDERFDDVIPIGEPVEGSPASGAGA
jgi:mono/diheme cytochrome c family protein